MQQITLNHSFHDCYFIGFLLQNETTAKLFIKDLNGDNFEIHLLDIEKIRIDNFREGNIILSISSGNEILADDPLIDRLLEIETEEMRGKEYYKTLISKLKSGDLIAFTIDPSYGAKVLALCKNISVVKVS
ncbi:hypothetical protein CHISP_0556 [Chitinispirillum alkaliphilum]|nr:hypothetical protein CHISP_0556 [Chitinispirillum alkaliphilum]